MAFSRPRSGTLSQWAAAPGRREGPSLWCPRRNLEVAAAMAAGPVRLWVRTEPFLVGALPAPPPARLSPHYLRKAAAYARARADQGCFPRLSWRSWRHIACGKLLLSPDIAWLYFELYRGLRGLSPPLRLRWAEAEASCTSAEELEWERSKARARPKAGGAPTPPKGEPGLRQGEPGPG